MRFLVILVILYFVSGSSTPIPIPSEVGKGQKFVDGLQDAIKTKDKKKIGEFFEDSFVFHGCDKNFNKTDSINLINALGPQMAQIIQKNMEIVYIGNIFRTTIQDSFIPMTAEWKMSPQWKLASGSNALCPEKKPP